MTAHHPGAGRISLVVTLAAAIGLMPAFLLGATGVLVRADVVFGPGGLGVGIAAFFAVSSCTYVLGGRLADHIGAQAALRLGAFGTAVALIGIAGLARTWGHLLALLALAGVANGISQPATSLALVSGIEGRRGLAFGIKQSAAPLATLFSGAAVPLIALTVGWRWAFAGTALAAVATGVFAPATPLLPQGTGRAVPGRVMLRPLVLLSASAAAAIAAATGLAAFFVESAVSNGIDPGTAGWLLVAGSLSGIATRVAAGWLADHRSLRPLKVSAVMLVLGAPGYALVAVGETPAVLFAGVLIAYALGWGWNGLFLLSIVNAHPDSAATATGVVLTGIAVGAAGGPLMVGALATAASFTAVWWAAGALVLVASGMMLVGERTLTEHTRLLPRR